MELGLGIHGEPGAFTAPMQPIDAIVAQVPCFSPARPATCFQTPLPSCCKAGAAREPEEAPVNRTPAPAVTLSG